MSLSVAFLRRGFTFTVEVRLGLVDSHPNYYYVPSKVRNKRSAIAVSNSYNAYRYFSDLFSVFKYRTHACINKRVTFFYLRKTFDHKPLWKTKVYLKFWLSLPLKRFSFLNRSQVIVIIKSLSFYILLIDYSSSSIIFFPTIEISNSHLVQIVCNTVHIYTKL